MSSSLFTIETHAIPAQHIREYRHATDDNHAALHLQVKHYRPLNNPSPQPGDVTIIGAHANGFPKEVYEPLWDDIVTRAEKGGFRIRGIWIADVAHQGQSGVMNEHELGNDPSWFDHPRDLLSIINHFRASMPQPLIGIGHSMGGNNIVQLSLIHPRLFHSVIMLDPVIQRNSTAVGSYMPAQASMVRRDIWPSREACLESMKKNPFYQAWDPRAVGKFVEFGLRELPTAVYRSSTDRKQPPQGETSAPKRREAESGENQVKEKNQDAAAVPVTLTTTKYQEVLSYFRPNISSPTFALSSDTKERPEIPVPSFLLPDLVPITLQDPFYRPEPVIVFYNLPHLRPSTLYIFGERSPMSPPHMRAEKMALTGTGVGGSGGRSLGRVKEIVVPRSGHLVPLEKVGETADAVVDWLGGELKRWREEDAVWASRWAKIPKDRKAVWTEEYERSMKGWSDVKERPQSRNSKI